MRLLEDYRHNELGSSYLVYQGKPEHRVYLTYQQHVTKAFYYSLDDIARLENSTLSSLHNGNQTHSSIAFWFLAIESYISTLVKIGCIKKDLNFFIYRHQDLPKRLNSLLDIYELDKREFNQNNLVAKVNEFCAFRNELFHDRHFSNELKFEKTGFSEIPFLSNQVDALQSALILLELTQSLRYLIAGLDTMPNTVVYNRDVVIWEKLDVCYDGVLKPSFQAALEKHKLSTKLDFHFPESFQQRSRVFKRGDLLCLLTAEQEERYFVELNETRTSYSSAIYQNFLNTYDYAPGTMRFPKTILDD